MILSSSCLFKIAPRAARVQLPTTAHWAVKRRHVKNGVLLSVNGARRRSQGRCCGGGPPLWPSTAGAAGRSERIHPPFGRCFLNLCFVLSRTAPRFVDSLWRTMQRRGGCTRLSSSPCPYSNHWRWVQGLWAPLTGSTRFPLHSGCNRINLEARRVVFFSPLPSCLTLRSLDAGKREDEDCGRFRIKAVPWWWAHHHTGMTWKKTDFLTAVKC